MANRRRVILEEINKITSKPTANEIYRMVRRRPPKISLAAVYRNLEIPSKFGRIQKRELAGTRKRFDRYTENHYIEWVEIIQGHKACLQFLKPGEAPEAVFPVEGDWTAREFCNLHGVWKS